MYYVALVVALACVGCGQGSLLGPRTENKTQQQGSITVWNYSSIAISSSTLKSFVRWYDKKLGGLKHKNIVINIYARTNNILGNADLGGEIVRLYVKSSDSIHKILMTLAHELHHLRGYTHTNMPGEKYFDALVKEFTE